MEAKLGKMPASLIFRVIIFCILDKLLILRIHICLNKNLIINFRKLWLLNIVDLANRYRRLMKAVGRVQANVQRWEEKVRKRIGFPKDVPREVHSSPWGQTTLTSDLSSTY